MQEEKHYLSVLIELELFPILRALTEGSLSQEQIDSEQQRMIIKFINEIPEDYRKIPDRDEIIARVLSKMGMQTVWGQKKIEEINAVKKRESNIKTKTIIKSDLKDTEEKEEEK